MKMNRRDLAKAMGLGGASLFLPNLRAASAAGGTPPKRLLIFYSQHGTLPWLWSPTGTPGSDPSAYKFGQLLAPLEEKYKKDIILVDGIDYKGLKDGGVDDQNGCGHSRGQASSLTANIQTTIKQPKAGGPSIDYYVSDGLKRLNNNQPVTPIPVVQAGIIQERPNVPQWGQPYQSAPGQNVLPEYDAKKVFDRLFPNGALPAAMPGMGMAPAAPNSEATQRKTALDFLAKEFAIVQNKLGKDDKLRLEHHANLITDLRQRIDLMTGGATGTGGGPTASCAVPSMVPPPQKKQNGYYDPFVWSNTRPYVPKLAQLAFACDLTRVFAIQVEDPPPSLYGGAAGYGSSHLMVHELQIDKGVNQPNQGVYAQSQKFYAEFTKIFLEVLDLLSEVKESDGKPLLYHTCVLWGGELATAQHTTANAKWLTAGNLGGYLKPGQWLKYRGAELEWVDGSKAGVPSNGDVLTTIANGFNLPGNFGSKSTKGPIDAMKA